MQKQTNGATKFSAKEAALIAEANAKAKATGKVIAVKPRQDIAQKAQTARSTKVNGGEPVVMTEQKVAAVKERAAKRSATQVAAKQPAPVTKVPSAAAQHATEKAPHTKRALEQSKLADKVAKANDALVAAKAALDTATKAAVASKRNDPARADKFLAKAHAEQAVIDAQKAVQALKREGETPEQKEARQAKAKTPKQRATKVASDQKIEILATSNPYREGCKAYATFEMFKRLKTVAAARAEVDRTGGSGAAGKYDIGYLRYSSRDGYIRLV